MQKGFSAGSMLSPLFTPYDDLMGCSGMQPDLSWLADTVILVHGDGGDNPILKMCKNLSNMITCYKIKG